MSNEGPISEPLARASAAFRAAFEREPVIAAAAPGRVNLIGEHTDYNGGFVLPMAIDRWTVAVAGPAADAGASRIVAADLCQARRLDLSADLSPESFTPGDWLSYVAGVAAIVAEPGRRRNLDAAIASSVPLGSGLASSAAIEVAVATMLESAWGLEMESRDKAVLCQRAEQEFAGVPCGLMDQFTAASARPGHVILLDCRTNEAEYIPMPPPDRALLVVADTHVRHALASGEYAARRSTCTAAAAKLGVRSLRDATPTSVEASRGLLTQTELRAARHVVTENARTLAAAETLRNAELGAMGRLMAASHASLRDDFHVSCPELDTLVDIASSTPGVFGARMTGGGFGGCIVALAEPGSVALLTTELREGYRTRHKRECTVFTTAASGGARVLRSP
jgi:galactokinase